MFQLQKLRIHLCVRLTIQNFLNFVTRILQHKYMVHKIALNCTYTFFRGKTMRTFNGYSSKTELVLVKNGAVHLENSSLSSKQEP